MKSSLSNTNNNVTLLLWIWCFLVNSKGINSLSWLDVLLGRGSGGPCSGAENKELELECQVNIVYEKLGILQQQDQQKQQQSVDKSYAIEQGKHAMDCMISMVPNGMKINLEEQLSILGGPYSFVQNLVYELYYNSMMEQHDDDDDGGGGGGAQKGVGSADERIERLCQMAQQRNSKLAAIRHQRRRSLKKNPKEKEEEGKDKDGIHDKKNKLVLEDQGLDLLRRGRGRGRGLGERHLQGGTPVAVNYPAGDTTYQSWVDDNLLDVLVNGDADKRADIDLVTELYLVPISILQEVEGTLGIPLEGKFGLGKQYQGGGVGDVLDSGLSVTEATFELVCNIFGVVEVGFDPGDACRIIVGALGVAIVLNAVALQRLNYELYAINAHNALINDVELEAGHTDTATLVTKLI